MNLHPPASSSWRGAPSATRTAWRGLSCALLWLCTGQSLPPAAAQPAKVASQLEIQAPVLTAAEERAGFTLPSGFEIELVAAETAVSGKFINVAFDARGRMWTMTALEYPVDANEDPEGSRQLFAAGGRDKVLVFDDPYGPAPAEPRVFVDGLVMPLGILPYRDGVFVQYGHDIRFYRDTDGNGVADTHHSVLTGFGTQDSHLFPHQFTRVPGGWILLAQGLFNNSRVQRPQNAPFADGTREVVFNHCKLARFKPDGSAFELLTAGPNNIWGLTVSRAGEIWLQEANDLGYPIIPFEPGGYYTTGSPERLRPYQPLMPPTLAPPQMGGTGLSGLALADDRDGWPMPWGWRGADETTPRVFYVANPIVSRIQQIEAIPGQHRYRYQKRPDFLTSADSRFRPVALQFGPDGCLYITDWYNKIISHNEVPRTHPDRDKLRGRIWRVRHQSQPRTRPPDLARLPTRELLDHLGADNARIADLAWQQLVDRQAIDLVPDLIRRCNDTQLSPDRRLGALWALEELAAVPPELLVALSGDAHAGLRYAAVRIAAAQWHGEAEFLAVAERLVDDPAPRVRAALGDALRQVPRAGPETIALMIRLAGASLPSASEWEAYDREFERYLARWALEGHPREVADFLGSPSGRALPLENRLWATLSLPGPLAAAELVRLIPELQRPLSAEELRTLVTHWDRPGIMEALEKALDDPASRAEALRSLLTLRTELDLAALQPALCRACQALWQESGSGDTRRLVMQAAGAFRIAEMERPILQFAGAGETSADDALTALRTVREIGATDASRLISLLDAPVGHRPAVRSEALAALAASPYREVVQAAVALLPQIDFRERAALIPRLAATREGCHALLAAVDAGELMADEIPVRALQQMRQLLPEDSRVAEAWHDVAQRVQSVLRLSGGPDDYLKEEISLSGPFTVEAWVRLDPGIGNEDGLLGQAGVMDLNFHAGRLRVWLAGHHDIVIAARETRAECWTHYAVTRDEEGCFSIYINGELDARSQQTNRADLVGLRVGFTLPAERGTAGQIAEFRVWDMARTAHEIREHFDRAFSAEAMPPGLVHYYRDAQWGVGHGNAVVEPALDVPELLTDEEVAARQRLFARFRDLASQPGSLERGQLLFARHCQSCHTVGGQGGQVGPALDGVGLTGLEAILRNTLTPSAAMEGGYRNFQLLTRDGRLIQGLRVAETEAAIVVRQPDAADQRVPRQEIERAQFTQLSIMPSGLLETLEPQEACDLLAYIMSLK